MIYDWSPGYTHHYFNNSLEWSGSSVTVSSSSLLFYSETVGLGVTGLGI